MDILCRVYHSIQLQLLTATIVREEPCNVKSRTLSPLRFCEQRSLLTKRRPAHLRAPRTSLTGLIRQDLYSRLGNRSDINPSLLAYVENNNNSRCILVHYLAVSKASLKSHFTDLRGNLHLKFFCNLAAAPALKYA